MSYQIHHGDNREVLKNLAENSIDSVVTDPPYELGFMGKSWDATGVAYSVELWQEVMRVLKPGGHLLAFSGSRTYHRMAVAIEDAGFEIRDQIMWIYGSGFPKSHDVSKGIDKQAGAEREILGIARMQPDIRGNNYAQGQREYGGDTVPQFITAPATAEAKQWQGWGTALKPAHEPIVVARKPLIGTVAANVLTYGTGGLNIDGARVEGDKGNGNWKGVTTPDQSDNIYAGGWDGSVKSNEPITPQGTIGRWPANVIHDGSDEVVELFPDSQGGAYPAIRGKSDIGAFAQGGNHKDKPNQARVMGDSGSAARFFYCAKASKRDRNEGLDGFEAKLRNVRKGDENAIFTPNNLREKNHHPTVKPTELMRYLCRLVTPPGGIVLDPFMGSGSTGKAAMYEGFEFVGIELTDEYLPIAKARIEFAIEEMKGRLL
jgi:site-specific DNA-methyltransferase (adenine-specific)